MVVAALRNVQLLVIAAAVATLLASCTGGSLEQLMAAEGLPSTALVRLSMERGLVADRDGASVRVVEFRQEGGHWVRQLLADSQVGDASSSLDLISLGGDTGDEWNTFVYGAAPDEVSRIDLAGFDGEGGRVVDGAWLIVLRERDLYPEDIEWRFVDSFGAVIESGSGVFPPAS